MEIMGITSVAAITVLCYLVAAMVKATKLDNKWLPTICGVCGAIMGAVSLRIMPDYPAEDIITAIAVGIVSGFAATGVDQAIKQLQGKE